LIEIVAICAGDCGRGKCMRPNQCLCPNGQVASSCITPGKVHATRRYSKLTLA